MSPPFCDKAFELNKNKPFTDEEDGLMQRFLQLFGGFVDFTYGVWDRIVLRGYYERLQRAANIVYFFRDVCGISPITPEVLAARTTYYRKWVDGYAAQRDIPILTAPKGVRKEDLVSPY